MDQRVYFPKNWGFPFFLWKYSWKVLIYGGLECTIRIRKGKITFNSETEGRIVQN